MALPLALAVFHNAPHFPATLDNSDKLAVAKIDHALDVRREGRIARLRVTQMRHCLRAHFHRHSRPSVQDNHHWDGDASHGCASRYSSVSFSNAAMSFARSINLFAVTSRSFC